jgi:hypothetical protein
VPRHRRPACSAEEAPCAPACPSGAPRPHTRRPPRPPPPPWPCPRRWCP